VSTGNSDGIPIQKLELEKLDVLFNRSAPMIFDDEQAPLICYKEKNQALSIIYDGYTNLPQIYHEVFLNPLRDFVLKQDYSSVLGSLDLDQGEGPWRDWLAAVHQRLTGVYPDHIHATHAFEECMADLYDGFLSMEERRGIKPPDHQLVSPLVEWGRPNWGPYIWPATTGSKFGMKMSVVSMPPAYSRNVALWSALGHETGGHAILHADDGLLKEIGSRVEKEIMRASVLDGQKAVVNGREVPLARCAAAYWKYTIDEAASDVCGILNLGPAAGIGLATLLIPLRKGILPSTAPSSDIHPIDALRILLAADVVRQLPDLRVERANAWADILEDIVNRFGESEKKFFALYTETLDNNFHWDDKMPYDGMRRTVTLVAEAIAFTPLDSLEGHHLSEINTWANSDEDLTWRIVDDLLKGKEPSLEPGPDGQEVYAAHLLAGAIIALAKSAEISAITKLIINSLNKLYNNNPVWRGFPVRFRSDAHLHNMVSSYRRKIPQVMSDNKESES
jgi:hypothetical protein